MIGKWIKNKFGTPEETPETEQFYSPLRIGLHSTLTINVVDFLTLEGQFHSNFKLPNGSLDVVAIGVIDNDPDEIFRIYAVDLDETPYIIQLLSSHDPRSGEKEVAEVLFLQQAFEDEPLTQEQWDAVPDRLGAEVLDVVGTEYQRVWGDDVEGVVDLFVFEEKLVALEGVKNYTNHQMLFGRNLDNLGQEVTEFVLIGVEEGSDSDTINTSIGFNISAQAGQVQ